MKQPSPLFELAKVSGLGIELALSVGLFTWLGSVADEKTGHDYLWTLIGFFCGLGTAILVVMKTIKRLS